jgi:hypothetical protein
MDDGKKHRWTDGKMDTYTNIELHMRINRLIIRKQIGLADRQIDKHRKLTYSVTDRITNCWTNIQIDE